MNERPRSYSDVEWCVEDTLSAVGPHIKLGTPLGLGASFAVRRLSIIDYVDFVRRGALPANIRVSEFYFQPRSFLDSPLAHQSYMSSNYTHSSNGEELTLQKALLVLKRVSALTLTGWS